MEIDLKEIRGTYEHNGQTHHWFDEEVALAYMLIHGTCTIHSCKYIEHGWGSDPEKEMPETTIILVNFSDLFVACCGDAQELPRNQIETLFDMWYDDNEWGSAKWCCIQRKQKPQKPIIQKMKDDGVWDDILENVEYD
jgi:hypothetical protein